MACCSPRCGLGSRVRSGQRTGPRAHEPLEFAAEEEHLDRVRLAEEPYDDEPEGWQARLGALLFPEPKATSKPVLVARGVFLLILAAWSVSFMLAGPRSPAIGESFLHLIHLVFHEAGHVVFMPFGRFLMVLGGGLFQVTRASWCSSSTS